MANEVSKFNMLEGELVRFNDARYVAVPASCDTDGGKLQGFDVHAFATSKEGMRVSIGKSWIQNFSDKYERTGKQFQILDAGLQVDDSY